MWTRREFVRGAAGVMALGRFPHGTSPLQLAYVASGQDCIEVFSVTGAHWTPIQRVPARAPACLLLSGDQRTLYVSNEVDVFEGFPRGSVETFRVDAVDGRLATLGRTPLSLSATRPRHMALSPDGKHLAVASYSGGLYNLLPVAEDGSLGQPVCIFKDTGCGPHPLQLSAHPHTLGFDASGGHLLATDFGSDRLNTFSVEHGGLIRLSHHSSGEGSGPGACALHPAGSLLYVHHELENTLAGCRIDPATGDAGEPIQRLRFASLRTFALDRSGRRLYTVHARPNELRLWHVEKNGMLAPAQGVRLGDAAPNHVTLHNDSVYLLDTGQGSISKVNPHSRTNERVALVDQPKDVCFKVM